MQTKARDGQEFATPFRQNNVAFILKAVIGNSFHLARRFE